MNLYIIIKSNQVTTCLSKTERNDVGFNFAYIYRINNEVIQSRMSLCTKFSKHVVQTSS